LPRSGPRSAAQLQHLRDIAAKGGHATASKYGGWHAAHAARHARKAGTYTPPSPRTPFAGMKRTSNLPQTRIGRNPGLLNLNIAKKVSSLAPRTTNLPRTTFGRSTSPTVRIPRSRNTTRNTTVRRR